MVPPPVIASMPGEKVPRRPGPRASRLHRGRRLAGGPDSSLVFPSNDEQRGASGFPTPLPSRCSSYREWCSGGEPRSNGNAAAFGRPRSKRRTRRSSRMRMLRVDAGIRAISSRCRSAAARGHPDIVILGDLRIPRRGTLMSAPGSCCPAGPMPHRLDKAISWSTMPGAVPALSGWQAGAPSWNSTRGRQGRVTDPVCATIKPSIGGIEARSFFRAITSAAQCPPACLPLKAFRSGRLTVSAPPPASRLSSPHSPSMPHRPYPSSISENRAGRRTAPWSGRQRSPPSSARP